MKFKIKKKVTNIFSFILIVCMCLCSTVVSTNAIDDEFYIFNGHKYKIFSGSFTWKEAKQKCEEMGGHLATITTSEEQKFIESINGSNVWIGGYRDDNFKWFWVTGEIWNYTNWNDGEPNNSNNVVSDERYVVLWPYKWNDLANSNIYEQDGFICEWDEDTAKVKSFEIKTKTAYKKLTDTIQIKALLTLTDEGTANEDIIKNYVNEKIAWTLGDSNQIEIFSKTAVFSNNYRKADITLSLKSKGKQKATYLKSYISADDVYNKSSIADKSNIGFYQLDEKGRLYLNNNEFTFDSESGRSPFYNNSDIKMAVLDDGVTSVGNHTFESCTNLRDVIIHKSIKKINVNAFASCGSLKDIYYIGEKKDFDSLIVLWGNDYFNHAKSHYSIFTANLMFRTDTNDLKSLTHYFKFNSDDFKGNNNTYNNELAKMTLGMVMAGFSSAISDEYYRDENESADEARRKNINDCYIQMDFDKDTVQYYNYDKSLTDSSDKVAYSIGRKTIIIDNKKTTLIAVIIRGGGYGAEWASNFNVGNNGKYHEGFYNASSEVVANIRNYISKCAFDEDDNVKLLIGGFSRSAAVANITAARLDNLANTNSLNQIKRNNIYAYTFATPQGIVDNELNDIHNSLYYNIFNFVNPRDLVPTVALTKWDFGRYGITKTFIAPNITYSFDPGTSAAYVNIPENMMIVDNAYKNITGKETSSFFLSVGDIQKIDNSVYQMASNTKILKYTYQNTIVNLFAILKSVSDGEKLTKSNINRALLTVYDADTVKHITTKAEYIYKGINYAELFDKSLNHDPSINIDKDTIYLLNIICAIIEHETGSTLETINTTIISLISSGIAFHSIPSLMNIGQNHYPELYLAWLESYNDFDIFKETNQSKVTVKCPVNVDVYSSKGELLASVKNNKVVLSSMPVYIEKDCKEFWLSSDDTYHFRITAYDSGTMNYSLEQYDYNFVMQKKTNFYDISLHKNAVFETTVSISADKSITLYDKNNNRTIYPSETLTKDDEKIEISVSCDANGYVYGNQTAVKGEYVSVTALPNDGYVFKGWFKENKLVSKDLKYYFNVIENVNLVAKFEKVRFIVGDTNGDESIDIADALMTARYDAGLIQLDGTQLSVSDVNKDESVDIADALMIARYDAGLITVL